jgi:hypothetical protein
VFSSSESHAGYDQNINSEEVGDLGPGAVAQGVVPIRVMGSTDEGNYVVKVETTYQNSDLELINITNQFIVIISEPKKLLEIKQVDAINASPGDEFNLTLVLDSDRNLENIRINIQPEELITLSSDSSIRKINKIIADNPINVSFTLATDKNIMTKSILIPVNTTYFYNGDQYYEPMFVGVNLKGRAELNLIDIETAPRKPATGNELSLRLELENVGSGDAENILVSLITDLYGIKRKTVGSIKKGLIGSASFDLTPGLLSFGSQRVRMEVNYEDELGDHTMIKEFDVHVFMRFPTMIVIISITIIAGVIAYKRFFKKMIKKKKKSD